MPPAPRALIFDMDELLVQSAPIWKAAEETLLRTIGQTWTPALSAHYKGMNALDVARTIHEIFHPPVPLAHCQRLMRDALIAGFAGPVEAMPGAVNLVRRVHGRFPLAVASGSPLAAIETALDKLGIRDCFAALVTSESVAHGKPDPAVFLAAARALAAAPADCLVFEDSLVGVQAARAAGMRCFVVPSLLVTQIQTLADKVFYSLADVALSDCEK